MLTNSQCDQIKRIYDERLRRAMDLKEERATEIAESIPEIAEINREIIGNSTRALTLSLLNSDNDALDNLKATNNKLIERKRNLLVTHGYPSDYLEDIYECPECQDTGMIKDQDGFALVRCSCYSKTVIDTFYITDTRRELLENHEKFDKFIPDYYSKDKIDEELGKTHYDIMQESVTIALDFCDGFLYNYTNLLIHGNTGTGKTFLANAIASRLLDKNISVLYLPAYTFFDITRKSCSSDEEENRSAREELEFIYTADCLVIDDLGTESITKFTNSQLFILLEKRHLNKKPTIITTNLSKAKISHEYSERVYSRLVANFQFLKMPGDDNRTKQRLSNI